MSRSAPIDLSQSDVEDGSMSPLHLLSRSRSPSDARAPVARPRPRSSRSRSPVARPEPAPAAAADAPPADAGKKKSRGFVWTLNNYTAEDVTRMKNLATKDIYVCFGFEVSPTTGIFPPSLALAPSIFFSLFFLQKP